MPLCVVAAARDNGTASAIFVELVAAGGAVGAAAGKAPDRVATSIRARVASPSSVERLTGAVCSDEACCCCSQSCAVPSRRLPVLGGSEYSLSVSRTRCGDTRDRTVRGDICDRTVEAGAAAMRQELAGSSGGDPWCEITICGGATGCGAYAVCACDGRAGKRCRDGDGDCVAGREDDSNMGSPRFELGYCGPTSDLLSSSTDPADTREASNNRTASESRAGCKPRRAGDRACRCCLCRSSAAAAMCEAFIDTRAGDGDRVTVPRSARANDSAAEPTDAPTEAVTRIETALALAYARVISANGTAAVIRQAADVVVAQAAPWKWVRYPARVGMWYSRRSPRCCCCCCGCRCVCRCMPVSSRGAAMRYADATAVAPCDRCIVDMRSFSSACCDCCDCDRAGDTSHAAAAVAARGR